MDCRRGQRDSNLPRIRSFLAEAAGQGARLVIFPECIVSGYCFDSLDEALPHGEAVPGPLTEVLGIDCRKTGRLCRGRAARTASEAGLSVQ